MQKPAAIGKGRGQPKAHPRRGEMPGDRTRRRGLLAAFYRPLLQDLPCGDREVSLPEMPQNVGGSGEITGLGL